MQTRDAAALPRLQILTDGDVEAVDAEGGTPTLPETMLLGVRFHRLDAVQSHLSLFNLFLPPLFSCRPLFQFRLSNSSGERRKKKKKNPALRLLFSAERRWKTVKDSPLLITDTEPENSFQVLFHALVFVVLIFSFPLSIFFTPQQAHFKQLMAFDLFFSSPCLPPPLPACFLSTSLFPKRYSRCVWWVAVVVVVVVVLVEGRRGHLMRSDNDRDSSFCQKFMVGGKH